MADVTVMIRERAAAYKSCLLHTSILVLLAFIIILWLLHTSIPQSQHFTYLETSHSRLHAIKSTIDNEECGSQYSIHSNTVSTRGDVRCVKAAPIPGSCDIARQLFQPFAPISCDAENEIKLCSIQISPHGNIAVHCDDTQCKRGKFRTAAIDSINGSLQYEYHENIEQVIAWLTQLVSPRNVRNHFGFCLISCLSRLQESSGEPLTQLLVLPPKLHRASGSRVTGSDKPAAEHININLILVDSVSRSHFYRSLPATVRTFTNINRDANIPATVLDYKLFQAIRHRTYESLEALFSGNVDLSRKPFGTYDMPHKPMNIQATFNMYREAGYSSMWSEDLCWTWEWGIVKDLRVHDTESRLERRWSRFLAALSTAGIDHYDVSAASCPILARNGVKDPFHGVEAVCYWGRYHHEYQLHYLAQYEDTCHVTRTPYLALTITDVAHEDTGRRIQTLDASLADYVTRITRPGHAAGQNTLTIIFSDHGNTYGRFVEATDEGSRETYHPALFMIVPASVEARLHSESLWQPLFRNQERLVSLVDVHHTLKYLLNRRGNPGLLVEVPADRTCADIPRFLPNHCICSEQRPVITDHSLLLLYADYAVAQLNNVLSEQVWEKHGPEGRCQRLVPHRISNIQETVSKDGAVVTSQMHVHIMNHAQRVDELFTVVLTTSPRPGVHSNTPQPHSLQLHSYQRTSHYGLYSSCVDAGVDVRMCVCDIERPRRQHAANNTSPLWTCDTAVVPFGAAQSRYTTRDVSSTRCHVHFIVTRYREVGISVELCYSCPTSPSPPPLQVYFDMQLINLTPLSKEPLPVTVQVHNQQRTHLLLAAVTDTSNTTQREFEYEFNVRVNDEWAEVIEA